MRPGTYKLTFSLTGFGTVVREGVNLPSNFTATVNAEMKVGSLEETINVSGTAPQVDVQQASRTTVIARDVIDSLPISRNVMGLGVLAAGVRPGTPDMGGMQTTEQVGLRARGLGGFDGEQQVEGMSVQSYEGGIAELHGRHPELRDDRHDRRNPGGYGRWRHPPEHDSEGRRQPVQRLRLHGRHPRASG